MYSRNCAVPVERKIRMRCGARRLRRNEDRRASLKIAHKTASQPIAQQFAISSIDMTGATKVLPNLDDPKWAAIKVWVPSKVVVA